MSVEQQPLEHSLATKETLRAARVELVKLQRDVIKTGRKVLILFEGRDAAGKDGTIKRIVQHLSPREPGSLPSAYRRTATAAPGTSNVMSSISP